MNLSVSRNGLVSLSVLAAITIAILLPVIFGTQVDASAGKEAKTGYVDYDIRLDKAAISSVIGFRTANGKDAASIADVQDSFVAGENALRERVPSLKIEYNSDLKIPEVIGPDVFQGKAFLTSASTEKRSKILATFLKQNSSLVGNSAEQIDELKVATDYKNPENDLSFVELEQQIGGIPVFRGAVKAGFAKDGSIIRVINNLAPRLENGSLSSDFGEAAAAVKAAAATIGRQIDEKAYPYNRTASSENKAVFGEGDFAVTAEKFYFPTEPGVAMPAWRVLIWQPVDAYYVMVDAKSGTLLWRKNITDRQTTSASYNVYANPGSMVNIADNPFPMTPGPTSPNGVQGTAISRTLITLVGNEAPYTFNNLGWITDGNNTTDGNNVEAGLDRELPNPAGAGIDPNGKATGNPTRTFNFPINPGIPTNPAAGTGDAPLPVGQAPGTCQAQGTATAPTDYQKAVVTQLFYISNRYHDEVYRLGFTEAARNFQNDNFGRGGLGADRVSAEAQDCSGTNNAGFSSPADGSRGRMQMFLWTAPTPDYDGSLDADVVIHELTHGLSNRLHGNSSGLGGLNMSRAMGEGWSDFYAHCMLSEPSDPINGIYPTGGYATYSPSSFTNYYYGIRRFPKAVMAFTGPNGQPHNPMTFNDIDTTKINLSNGAFAPAFGTTADGVHAGGEIWSSALWEIRARYINRLEWAAGNRRILQHVTDGMKLAPLTPTFLQERDAIIAGALASGTAEDVEDMWAGFAIRGLGASASIQNTGGVDAFGSGTGLTRVTEAFDLPNLLQDPNITVSDSTGDGDGVFEPGEPLRITVPLKNITGKLAENVSAQIVGGGSASYGSIAHNGTASNQISFTVPANTPCGSAPSITINVTSSLGATNFQHSFQIGSPTITLTENFDGVTAPAIPATWSAAPVQSGINFVTTTNNADSAPNAAFAANPAAVGGGTDLTSPTIPVTASAATVSFRNRFDTESAWDGGVLEISINGGPFQDILTAGGTFVQNGYTGPLGADGVNNPLNGRNAWNGNSNGYLTTTARLPAAAAGQNVQLKFRFGADDNTTGTGPNPGWYIDNVQVAGQFSCSFSANVKSRADFDGDGKSDLSVFRPSESKWYVTKSSGGTDISGWGLAGDKIVPGRYDSDNKTDLAVFRPSENRWYILGSNNFTISTFDWGLAGDIVVPGDYNGDGRNDPAVFRPSDNKWYAMFSTGGVQVTEWGLAGDIPVPGDYDGDGKNDAVVYRNGVWFAALTTGSIVVENWGLAGDKIVPADYDGDGKDDFAVFRPSNGNWYVRTSSNSGISIVNWGLNGDVPVPGDFDGDGRDDPAVYRNGTWFVAYANGGILTQSWGFASDIPVPAAYIP